MKITLNLATPSSARERYAVAWAIPGTAVGLAALIALSVAGVKDYRAYRRVRDSVAEIKREETRVQAQEAALRKELERPQLRDIYRHTRFINGVIERREFSMTRFVEKVTELVPGEVRLEGLALDLDSEERLVRLAVSANTEEALEKFLVNLEDSPDFADVTIVSHGLPEEQEGESELATVSCTARYVGGLREAGGKTAQ